ncbi:hypothetical protein BGZ61DRAFT_444760 [Ilyonectria robusta]|uniref:uncharacterized protein n=1 Tax=Ilyonectria robusta TaxID=1079257 RepID=UPI001E8D8005|nr:uncharacterized protein BGZ61DRAFT_444760 [Ilyonectria robusta]KAH8733518.1 hypothetical protein BGZ61DRAFT_444760 [Ilyonectria robusta]
MLDHVSVTLRLCSALLCLASPPLLAALVIDIARLQPITILILTIILNTSTVLRFHHSSSIICPPSALLLFPRPSATALLLIGVFPSSQPLKVHCPSATPCCPCCPCLHPSNETACPEQCGPHSHSHSHLQGPGADAHWPTRHTEANQETRPKSEFLHSTVTFS